MPFIAFPPHFAPHLCHEFHPQGGDVFTLQRILGHANIKTCMVYVHMSGKHVREAMLRFSPVDRMEW